MDVNQIDAFIAEDEPDYPFEIRYEGRDAERHHIDMASLAESLDGFSRIYAVAAHFATTGQYAKQMQALNAKAYVREPKAKCVSIAGVVAWATTNGVFQGLGGVVITLVLNHIYQRNSGNKEEMKHLRELFEKQLGFNQKYVERLMDTVDKLADALQPSVKKSVAPIGETCDRIDLYGKSGKQSSIGLAEKEAILSAEPAEILPERKYSIVISGLDRITKTCKISFTEEDTEESVEDDGSPRRISCDITDPVATLVPNPYLDAFATGRPVRVTAKAMLKNGVITKLFISDAT
ncbi:hypothetical protein [Pseudomonas sp. Snoq117.2]|uniref:DUF7946 domain-containing protein n=1 Tax=Pseudomonas sp. Snoq117.2 TaxID=1500302 RepID=UPI0008C38881|nr:hypothetical protein [Pseudomonas sp. Snoq117.2]SEO43556.1 hypothetical protein SAMN02787149_10165 [Pseudomonas sp. Snoq117.2]